MAPQKDRADFNTRVHDIFEKIGAGELPPDVAERQAAEAKAEKAEKEAAKDPAAVALGSKGGKKGGPVRQALLSAEERKALGQKGAAARWKKPPTT